MAIAALSASPSPLVRSAEKIAQEFEAMALADLLAPVFESLDTKGLGGGGMGERMFRPMLVQNYAQGLAASGGVGIAKTVLAEILNLQGANDGVDR
jgi:Rod binding domain-containing protein